MIPAPPALARVTFTKLWGFCAREAIAANRLAAHYEAQLAAPDLSKDDRAFFERRHRDSLLRESFFVTLSLMADRSNRSDTIKDELHRLAAFDRARDASAEQPAAPANEGEAE